MWHPQIYWYSLWSFQSLFLCMIGKVIPSCRILVSAQTCKVWWRNPMEFGTKTCQWFAVVREQSDIREVWLKRRPSEKMVESVDFRASADRETLPWSLLFGSADKIKGHIHVQPRNRSHCQLKMIAWFFLIFASQSLVDVMQGSVEENMVWGCMSYE